MATGRVRSDIALMGGFAVKLQVFTERWRVGIAHIVAELARMSEAMKPVIEKAREAEAEQRKLTE